MKREVPDTLSKKKKPLFEEREGGVTFISRMDQARGDLKALSKDQRGEGEAYFKPARGHSPLSYHGCVEAEAGREIALFQLVLKLKRG